MIRIIHYLPSINCTSGIANLLMNYYRKIDREMFQFHFVYFSKKNSNNFEKEIESLGGSATYIVPPTKLFQFKTSLTKYLEQIKANYNIDTFIFQNHQIAFTIFMYKIIKNSGINCIIVHNHMVRFSNSLIKSFRNMVLFRLLRKKDIIYFSCSTNASKLLTKHTNKCMRDIFVMNNAIDCNSFKYIEKIRNEVRSMLDLNNSFVVGHVGHFENVKNHKFILRVFEQLYKKQKDSKLLLVGNGPLKNKYISIINKKPYKKNVIILSERNDVSNLLNAMDCFIFPSKSEGLGIAAIEAQASGLPTFISERVPKNVNIINCKQIKLSSFKEWVKEILTNKPKNRNIGYKKVQNTQFDINKSVANLEKKYINILGFEERN